MFITDPTAALVRVKGADTLPAGTVTVMPGTRLLFDEEIVTAAPPVGAGADKNTVPLTELPPVIVCGLKLKPLSVIGGAGVITRDPCPEFKLYVAVTETVVCADTAEVVIGKDTLVAPLAG